MMSTYNYQHHPLADSVSALRLVRILPRSSNGLICCEIVQTDLANEPEFEGETLPIKKLMIVVIS